MKKHLYCIVMAICMWMGFVGAQSISLIPQGEGVFGNGCIVPIDVYVDTNGYEIAAMDLMFETSLNFENFIATGETFQYFFPVVKSNNLFHIVGFSVDASEREKGLGKVGTLYFFPKEGDIDGVVRLYYLGEGNTTDTNLSILGGIDVLKNVLGAFVSFSDDVDSCEGIVSEDESEEISVDEQNTYYAHVLEEDSLDSSYSEELATTMNKIDENSGYKSPVDVLKKNIWIIILLLLVIVVLFVNAVLSFRKELSKGKKKVNKGHLKKN